MQGKCDIWESHKLSWLGRVAAVKMILLPKIIFILTNALIDLPDKILNSILYLINKFIWGKQKARIRAPF